MTSLHADSKTSEVPFRALTLFLIITFGLAWGILGLYIFLPHPMTALFGQLTGQHPLFFLCVYSPAIAAFIIVARSAGWEGLGLFLSRILRWRCSPAWYFFLIIGVPLVFYAGSALNRNLFTEPFPFTSIPLLFAALLFAAIKGPVEEFGWRGLALPLLQRKFAPFWAAVILGGIWGLWHLPAFLLSGTQQSEWSFAAFFAGCIVISIIATALFNDSRGSILLAAFFHFNLMNPLFPEAQPYDTYLLTVVVVILVCSKRKAMFGREDAYVEVIPSSASVQETS